MEQQSEKTIVLTGGAGLVGQNLIAHLKRFRVQATPFARAINETFNDPIYSKIVLEF